MEPAARCQADRNKTLGWAAKCDAAVGFRAMRRFLPPDADRLQRCEDRFVSKFAKIEDRANGTCSPALGDATAVLDAWRACVQPVGASLGGPMGVGNDTDRCQSMKVKEAGRYADCRFTAQSKAHKKGVTPDFSRCDDKLEVEFAKLERRGSCATTGDAATVRDDLTECFQAASGQVTDLTVARTTDQITLVESRTLNRDGHSFELNFYRNEAYTCGLSGNYTFMVVEPANNPGAERPLWAYLHGGGYGWFDENQIYQTVKTLTMNTWNHEETFDDFIDKHLLYNTVRPDGEVMSSTLTRRIQEGYRVLFPALCDHDNYSGRGAPYPNNPNPNGGVRQVNGLQATMAAVDYTVAQYPSTQVFAHGTSAGSIGVWAMSQAYIEEGVYLTAVVADSWTFVPPRVFDMFDIFVGQEGYVFNGGDLRTDGMDKIGFPYEELGIHPLAKINGGFTAVPHMFIIGEKDPGCAGYRGGILPTIPEAEAAGLSNCGWMYDELVQAIDNQPNSPHVFDLSPTGDHVETNRNNPVNDRVDTFLNGVWSTNPPHVFPDGDGGGPLPALPAVDRTTAEIELIEEHTQDFAGNAFELDHYRNDAYECGLTGNHTFMVVNPRNGDETTEAPLWVYLHGGGSGYFDDTGIYRAVGAQDENTWNHEETFDDLYIGQVQQRMIENGQLRDITLTRRAIEGYRLVFVSMCDHDQYLGLGTEYPNNPNAPKQVNGLQANMAAVDFAAAYYPTTHVFAHGTSAGSVGAYALGMSYSVEGVALTGVISDSVLAARGVVVQDELAGMPGFPQQEGYEPTEFIEKAGFYRQPENRIEPALRIAAGFDMTPLMFVGGLSDPQCGATFAPLEAAVADGFDDNCEWVAAEVIEAIEAQPNSPHEVAVFEGEGHVPTNNVTPANDAVDAFIAGILAGNPAPPFGG